MSQIDKKATRTVRVLAAIPIFAVMLAIQVCLSFGVTAASAQEVGTYAYVDAQALNMRAGPGTGAAILRTLPAGTSVSILVREGSWAKVFVQGATGQDAEGWVSTRFLSSDAGTANDRRGYDEPTRPYPSHPPAAGLRVSKLDFDCRPALFGDNGIRKCVASARVQLLRQEYDPDRNDLVFVACRGVISYRTTVDRFSHHMAVVERASISRDDRLGQSVRVDFPVRSVGDKVVSARLVAFSCGRD
ncbi:SH3 domain-containing protein [uncultured Aliiroseovarius sp.]|uniref:SH3 domain-containing protein n=1 Tax=uncultured Aliiroseovarius sp. TaxID=1658783 RepID=UPI0025963988|nr:SH3 domain-containing protein [uncultured Aliiroseovarius sp.]